MIKNGQLTISRLALWVYNSLQKSDVIEMERTEHNRLRISLARILNGLYIFPIIYNIEKAMKTLLILRHAKSSWKEQDLQDHDRLLNKRGKNDAPRMGKLLKDENLIPDLIMSSTAVRAKKTAELVAKACKYKGKIVLNHSLYGTEHPAPTLKSWKDFPINI